MPVVIPYVSAAQQALVEAMLATIVGKTKPEKIICYGMRTGTSKRWSIFSSAYDETMTTALDLLIVVEAKDKRDRETVANVIDSLGSDNIRMVAVVHSIDAVNNGLAEGNPFFTTLYYKGALLYDKPGVPMVFPSEQGIGKRMLEANQRKRALASVFFETARNCATAGRHDVAALLLHQVVELSCNALLRTVLGYRPTTHSLKKLLALTENISPGLRSIFPGSTREEEVIFDILQRAYSDVRYKEEYTISPENLFVLLERVGAFVSASETLCQQKTASNDSPADSRFRVEHDVMPFDSIRLDIGFDVVLRKGDKQGVSIEAGEDVAHILRVNVADSRLHLYVENNSFAVIPHATIYITCCKLRGLVVNHSGEVMCTEPIETDYLGIVQNGNGRINLQVSTHVLDATLTKTGSLKLSGSADKVTLLNTGSANIDCIDLEVSEGKVTIKGSGDIAIHVEDELRTLLEGEGRLHLKGEPRMKSLTMKRPITISI